MKATVTALQMLRSPREVAELRGLTVAEVLGTNGREGEAGEQPPPEADAGEAAPEGGPVATEAT